MLQVPITSLRLSLCRSSVATRLTPKDSLYCHWKRNGTFRYYTASTEQPKQKTILTEHVYGRTRIYTSTLGKTKSATASRTCIASPVTSPPLTWEWLHPGNTSTSGDPHKTRRSPSMGDSFVSGAKQHLKELFLPVGYPENLHPCYKKFHIWLGMETYISSAIGVLCSQAMLASLGLGTVEATGGAVAIQWVLKDGIGEFGKLFFIKRYASSFDSHSKTWKFVSEILSSVGSFLQLCTCIASPKLFLPLAAVGNMFELIHESVWIASHMTFTKHFSPNGNIGDIVAKDDAQMSIAHLLGMLSGVGLITVSHGPAFLFTVFGVLTPFHIWTTVKMIDSAKFEILNQAKLTLLSREYINSGQVVSYDQLRSKEFGFGEWIHPQKGNIKVKLELGASAEDAYGSADEIQGVISVLKDENYLLNYHNNTMYVMFHDDAEVNDVMKSVLHAMKFHDHLSANNLTKEENWDTYLTTLDDTLEWTDNNFQPFVDSLDKHQWQRENVYWTDGGMRLTWEGREINNEPLETTVTSSPSSPSSSSTPPPPLSSP